MSLPHASRLGYTKLIGSRAARSCGHSSSALRSTRSRSVWCSGSILLLKHHNSPQKKRPKVCNIVGGVVSPLLANIALHGMETQVAQAFTYREGKPNFVRYADDFVVFHPTEAGVQKAKAVLETWLKDIGLELKPSKTRITHTLQEYQGVVGFDFLGWTVRQFPTGKTHTGKAGHYGPPLGFKT